MKAIETSLQLGYTPVKVSTELLVLLLYKELCCEKCLFKIFLVKFQQILIWCGNPGELCGYAGVERRRDHQLCRENQEPVSPAQSHITANKGQNIQVIISATLMCASLSICLSTGTDGTRIKWSPIR